MRLLKAPTVNHCCMQGLAWPELRCISSTGEASSPADYAWLYALTRYRAPIIEYCGGASANRDCATDILLPFFICDAKCSPNKHGATAVCPFCCRQKPRKASGKPVRKPVLRPSKNCGVMPTVHTINMSSVLSLYLSASCHFNGQLGQSFPQVPDGVQHVL